MYTIRKTFAFEAAHHLPHLPEGHKCRRPHGHSYRATVELRCPRLDDKGFVLDYGALDCIKADIAANIDHRDLNVDGPQHVDEPTTAENLARAFFFRWKGVLQYEVGSTAAEVLSAVEVSETRGTMARFEPEAPR